MHTARFWECRSDVFRTAFHIGTVATDIYNRSQDHDICISLQGSRCPIRFRFPLNYIADALFLIGSWASCYVCVIKCVWACPAAAAIGKMEVTSVFRGYRFLDDRIDAVRQRTWQGRLSLVSVFWRRIVFELWTRKFHGGYWNEASESFFWEKQHTNRKCSKFREETLHACARQFT